VFSNRSSGFRHCLFAIVSFRQKPKGKVQRPSWDLSRWHEATGSIFVGIASLMLLIGLDMA